MHHTTNHFKRIQASAFCIVFVACWAPQPSESAAGAPAQTNSAPNEQKTWARTFGGHENENVSDICRTDDGGFVVAGAVAWENYTKGYGYLLRLNASGEKVWCRTYGGENYDGLSSVRPTPDGGFIAVGTTGSFGAKQNDIYMVRIDADGAEQWHRTIGGEAAEWASQIERIRDGGYVIVANAFASEDRAGLLVRVDPKGNELWQHTFRGEGSKIVTGFCVTADGGFMLVGTRGDPSFGGPKRGFLTKTDGKGIQRWSKTYGWEVPSTVLSDVQETREGGYIAVGTLAERDPISLSDIVLLRTDSVGNELWHRRYGTVEFHDQGYRVLENPDGHFVIAGLMQPTHDDRGDLLLMKVDNQGMEIWQRRFGGPAPEKATKILSTSDGGYVMGGWSSPYPGKDDSDCYVVKTDSKGQGPPIEQATPLDCPELAATQ